jgi:hypothetical protein
VPFPPYPNQPAPSTWHNGPVTTGELRDDVTNAISFLANRPSFLGYSSNNPTIIGDFEATPVGLDTELWDTWGGHWPLGPNPDWWYFVQPQATGYYLAEGYVPYNYTSATEATFAAGIASGTLSTLGNLTYQWGEQHPVGSGRFPGPFCAEIVTATAGGAINSSSASIIGLFAAQDSGSGVNLAGTAGGGAAPRLSLRWVSALSGTAPLPVPANPAWPVPPAIVDAETWLNPNIRDVIRFLTYPPLFRATFRGTVKMPSGTFPTGTVVPLDTLTQDNYNGFDGSSGYVTPVPGVYYCYGQAAYAPSSASLATYCAGFTVGGGTTQWGKAVRTAATGHGVCVSAVRRFRCTAGQLIQLVGAQSTGAQLQVDGGGGQPVSKLIVLWESA